ncbi:(2Fe-2S)-binding protein [Gammaproteobacteria bacterium]|jgi:bacterioferritin-associated ferredoxin|nr:(2Fe-2S)-binding protein [Gammaproteobacteria bacterium]
MYVCICRQVTDNQIRETCKSGCGSFSDLRAQLGVASECGRCSKLARSIVKEFGRTGIPSQLA